MLEATYSIREAIEIIAAGNTDPDRMVEIAKAALLTAPAATAPVLSKKTIYACHCGCTSLWRDASQDVNDEDNINTFDNVICGDCGYDGRTYFQVDVPGDFDTGYAFVDKAVIAKESQVYL